MTGAKRAVLSGILLLALGLLGEALLAQKSGGGTGGTANVTGGPGIAITGSAIKTIASDTAVMATRAQVVSGTDQYCEATLAGSAFTCSMAGNDLTAVTEGMVVQFKPDQACPEGPTITIDTLGPYDLFEPDGTTDMSCEAGIQIPIYYDGTAFRKLASSGGGSGPKEVIRWITVTGGTVATGGAVHYFLTGFAPNVGFANRSTITSQGGTLKNFRVQNINQQPASGALACKLYSAADTAIGDLEVTISAGASANTVVSDITNTATVTAGQLIAMGCSNASATDASALVQGVVEIW